MQEIKEYLKNDKYAELSKITLEDVSPGYAVAKMPVEDCHMNAAGTVQGGAIYTLADYAFAAASNSRGRALGIQSNISYFKPAKGRFLTARAKENSLGNRLSSYTVDILDEDGSLIALFQATAYRKNP